MATKRTRAEEVSPAKSDASSITLGSADTSSSSSKMSSPASTIELLSSPDSIITITSSSPQSSDQMDTWRNESERKQKAERVKLMLTKLINTPEKDSKQHNDDSKKASGEPKKKKVKKA